MKALRKIWKQYQEFPCIAFPTVSEYYYGGLRNNRNIKETVSTLSNYPVIESSPEINQKTAILRYELEKAGKMIGSPDTMIAAVALAENAVLVTKDKHFERIPGLRLILLD